MRQSPSRISRLFGEQQLAWDLPKGPTSAERADRELRLTDLIFFALMPFAVVTAPLVGVPLNEVAIALCCLFALVRVAEVRVPAWFTILTLALIVEIGVSSILNDVPGNRRLLHLALFVAVALLLGFGRISSRSAATGLAVGLIAASVLSMIGLGQDVARYEGRLTGMFGDPNLAAYYLTVLGPLALAYTEHPRLRQALYVVLPVALVLTYSRTGLLACAAGLVWMVWGKRLGLIGGGALVAAVVWMIGNIPDNLRLYGPFSDRSGSDALRDRILASELALLRDIPWYGKGPGSAVIELPQGTFFFHNSYLAVRAEGGWILLAIVLTLMAVSFLSLIEHKEERRIEATWVQLSLISVLVMGINLGEVFLELPTALALGFAAVAYRERIIPPDRDRVTWLR